MPIGKTPVKEAFWEYIQMWVGKIKIGKTKTAAQIKDILFLLTESGASDLGLDHWMLKGWNPDIQGAYIISDPVDYDRILVELEDTKPEDRPKTIAIDTADGMVMSKVYSLVKEYRAKDSNVLTINDGALGFGRGWNMVAEWLVDIVVGFQRLNVGLIFITHLEEKTITKLNQEPKTVWRSTLPDKAKTILQGIVDFIWFFNQEGKERWIYTQGDMSIEAGSRIKLPDRIPMGKSPEKCYQNILTAFYGNSNKDFAKEQLVTKILKGEAFLATKKIDSFDTEKRKLASRKKHLNIQELELAGLPELEAYFQHLKTKANGGS